MSESKKQFNRDAARVFIATVWTMVVPMVVLFTIFFIYPSYAAAADVTYNDPQESGRDVADVPWNGATDEETAIAFCQDQGQTYVSFDIQAAQDNGQFSVRNYNNTSWQNTNYAFEIDQIVCDDGTTTGGGGSTTTPPTVGTTTVPTLTPIYYCNNALIGDTCLDSQFLFFGFFIYLFTGFFVIGIMIVIIRLLKDLLP